MSRLVQANGASRCAVQVATPAMKMKALLAIHDVLWPVDNPADVNWDVARCEAVAEILANLREESINTQ